MYIIKNVGDVTDVTLLMDLHNWNFDQENLYIDVTDRITQRRMASRVDGDINDRCEDSAGEESQDNEKLRANTRPNSPQEGHPVETRTRINQRERRRMHDLNVAMDALREVMPYANGPSVRKLSKIATLSLARNYIQMLTKSVEELKHMLDEAYRTRGFQGPYQRMAPPVHPGAWSLTPRDYRRLSSFQSFPSLHSPCTDSCDGAYSCCSMYSATSRLHSPIGARSTGLHGSTNGLQRQ